MTIFLNAIAAQFYRGIGQEIQYIGPFSRVNFFIGSNNAGKSTALKLLADHLRKGNEQDRHLQLTSVDVYRGPQSGQFQLALGVKPASVAEVVLSLADENRFNARSGRAPFGSSLKEQLTAICRKLTYHEHIWISPNAQGAWELFPQVDVEKASEWRVEWQSIWNALTGMGGGNANNHWIPDTLKRSALASRLRYPSVQLIPAKRELGEANEAFDDLSGKGLIDHLAELQNPHWDQQQNREKFIKINKFLRDVTGKPTAELEVPFSRKHLLVHMDNKVLPLSSLGTGVHEVVLIAAFCTIHDNSIMSIEEPEIHLHPLLQKKLINYLIDNTTSQYFIATHSAAFIDTPGANIFHVSNDGVQTRIKPILTKDEQREILDDLGYLASDILQANAVIWVEGPSDRIYINHWIKAFDAELREGIHYTIMFYGGALIRHLSASDDALEDFIKLKDLNRHMAIILDSDRDSKDAALKPHAQRIEEEMAGGAGMVWVTSGREIENYVDGKKLQAALKSVHPRLYLKPGKIGRFDNSFYFYRDNPRRPGHSELYKGADKVEVAHRICDGEVDLSVLDLRDRLEKLVSLVRRANRL